MTSEARNEFNAQYDNRRQKIREAAVAAIKELDQLRLVGPVTQEALDAEVVRIAQRSCILTDAISLSTRGMMGPRVS